MTCTDCHQTARPDSDHCTDCDPRVAWLEEIADREAIKSAATGNILGGPQAATTGRYRRFEDEQGEQVAEQGGGAS